MAMMAVVMITMRMAQEVMATMQVCVWGEGTGDDKVFQHRPMTDGMQEMGHEGQIMRAATTATEDAKYPTMCCAAGTLLLTLHLGVLHEATALMVMAWCRR
jgi:hypothetical protein